MNTLLTTLLISLSYSQTVVDIAINSELTTILEAAVVNNGLAGTLSGTGPFTVFAPTDAAFTALGLNGNNIDAQILLNHVIQANSSAGDFVDQQKYTTLAGDSYQITFQQSPAAIIDSTGRTILINTTDIFATNGVVHLIDGVILPGTIVNYVVEDESLSTLEAAVINANLTSTLTSAGPFTLLAPMNMSFDAIKTISLYLGDNDKTKLTNLLTYHVIPGLIMAADLVDGIATTVNGNNLTVTASTASFTDRTGQTCNVTKADIRRSNGVIHIINCVLRDETIVDIAANDAQFSTLVGHLTTQGLVPTLNGAGPFTVFAPVNSAFTAIPSAYPVGSQLTNTLLYHVNSGVVTSDLLSVGLSVPTLFVPANTNNIPSTLYVGQITPEVRIFDTYNDTNGLGIEYAKVTTANIYSTNGVIHVVNKVLLYGNIINYVLSDPLLVILGQGVGLVPAAAAALSSGNSGMGYTLLAPKSTAFQAIPTINLYLNNPTKLGELLNYHVIPTTVLSMALQDGMVVTTAAGKNLTVVIMNNNVYFQDVTGQKAMVVKKDIVCSNGVVHIIDSVLRDSSIVDIVVNSPSHTILEASLIDAGLVSTLQGPGPFTVFAPVDSAFTDSVKARINASTMIRDNTLLYHVIGGTAASNSTVFTLNGQAIKTLSNNITLDINITNSILKIQDTKGMAAKVTTPDLFAPNGIVHVTDYVFEYGNVVDYVVGNVMLNSLEAAVISADLVTTLSGTGPFTILAPTDAAFASANISEYTGDLLKKLLKYHVISGKITSDMLVDGATVTTLQGSMLTVKIMNSNVYFMDELTGQAMVTKADIITSNGVLHIINNVLRFNISNLPATTMTPTTTMGSNSYKLSVIFVITLTMFVFFFLN